MNLLTLRRRRLLDDVIHRAPGRERRFRGRQIGQRAFIDGRRRQQVVRRLWRRSLDVISDVTAARRRRATQRDDFRLRRLRYDADVGEAARFGQVRRGDVGRFVRVDVEQLEV